MRLHERLSLARAGLVEAGLTTADAAIDVDFLARTILGWDRARMITEQATEVPPGLEPRLSEWLERRARREPSAYIAGFREFWGLEMTVTAAVLIPRPETEFIVEEALPLLKAMAAPRIADIGTGSGCLAVSLAHEVAPAHVVATDISEVALAVARLNAAKHGVADRVACVRTSYLDGIDGPFDLVVANPPYVKTGDKPALARDVLHEPDLALFGGADGLRDVGGVLGAAERVLVPGGWLLMEFGYGQEEGVRQLVGMHPALSLVRIREDLQGIARTAIMRRI
ncbi:MAG: peptide chain release factor N(5)-glutamine methyltransferase [Vicinamibacterales bacterium]